MASQTLPSDIIIDILTRLPSKTLIRFKSVCKQWYSLINSPNFINLHLTQTLISQNSPNLIIISQYFLSSITISDENNPNFHVIELDHPLKHLCETHDFPSYDVFSDAHEEHMPQILGSINGIVCISMNDQSSVVLYNPSTTHRFIPPFPPSPNPIPPFGIIVGGGNVNHVVFGFGFDSVREDYKVLRIIERGNLSGAVYREASVYSLKNDSWKCVDNLTMMGQFIFQNSMGVFVNEILHFIVTAANFNPKIKCFDLRTETFSTFHLPIKDDEGFCRKQLFMMELDGCFGVLVNYQFGISGIYSMVFADFWVMKEYGNKESWFKLFSIPDLGSLECIGYVRPVLYSKDKERVLLELDGMSFGWYSWGSKKLDRITVDGRWFSADPTCETWTFVDSLVLIGRDEDRAKPKVVPKKNKNKDDFLSSGFKLRL